MMMKQKKLKLFDVRYFICSEERKKNKDKQEKFVIYCVKGRQETPFDEI